ncbi:MAG: hypothetical protein PHS95_03085 [Candidatus Pacebacteria bacterium]|nr:hypothetical protein [Candidatus Paceibacterota bacterium]
MSGKTSEKRTDYLKVSKERVRKDKIIPYLLNREIWNPLIHVTQAEEETSVLQNEAVKNVVRKIEAAPGNTIEKGVITKWLDEYKLPYEHIYRKDLGQLLFHIQKNVKGFYYCTSVVVDKVILPGLTRKVVVYKIKTVKYKRKGVEIKRRVKKYKIITVKDPDEYRVVIEFNGKRKSAEVSQEKFNSLWVGESVEIIYRKKKQPSVLYEISEIS